ncbi:hypothetical protein C8N25_107168 [Algoriphagus antarcticus]|uniref:Uncharacterized protein n=2 Tax=Algoriphagus antarcticus TaxID=238540 RepID=A0A3E0DWK5_9BACT|nr:hypothetical protein C8N25_107168 [Algoriphagus antarcticus]
MMARHFHLPTFQWAGTHSRNYITLLPLEKLAFLSTASNGTVEYAVNPREKDLHRLKHNIPTDLIPYFKSPIFPRLEVDTFLRNDHPIKGNTFLQESFTLGSVNRSDFWNQRRPMLVYWGEKELVSFLQPGVLNNGYDFAVAQFFCVQHENMILCGINFATDGENTQINLDRLKEGQIYYEGFETQVPVG